MTEELAPSEWMPWDTYSPSILQSNLRILETTHPTIHAQVESLLHRGNYVVQKKGRFTEFARRGQAGIERFVSAEDIQHQWTAIQHSIHMFTPLSEATLIIQLGFDLGNTHDLIFSHLNRSPSKALVIVEPDLLYFAGTLAVKPLDRMLKSNRCFVVVGDDWRKEFRTLFDRMNFFTIEKPDIFPSGTARQPGRLKYWGSLKETIGQWIKDGRQAFDQEIENTVQYYQNKRIGEIKKIFALHLGEQDGKAIPYIQKQFLDVCRERGLEIIYHEPSFRSDVGYLRTLALEKPDVLLFINKSPREYTHKKTLDRIRIPRMIWCLDDPNCFMQGNFHPHDIVFTWDMSYEKDLQAKQAESVDHFPYVADLDAASPHIQERFRSPVSFIGQVKIFDPSEFNLDENTGRLIEHIGRLKAESPGKDYQTMLWEHQRSFQVHLVDSAEDPIPQMVRYGIYIVANALRRIRLLEAALPFGLKLYGNKDWETLLGDHPLRECYMGPADPQKDVPDIFVSSEINLNIHSLQALTSLNQRDFNCPLVGGFLLTDWIDHADDFFIPGEEMVFYHNFDDLQSKIGYYLEHLEERNRIVRQGRERVLRDHTYARRVPRVLETLQKRIDERFVD